MDGETPTMVALIVHLVIGFVLIAVIVRSNPRIFARFTSGPQLSKLEIFYYIVGVASVVLGYYFNNEYVQAYAPSGGGMHNFIWGPGSWSEFIALGYANPAAASASQDYTIMSLLIFPVFVVVDARRRGIKGSWLYCVLLLVTSSAFPWAFYLATVERQRRHKLADVEVASRA
jgi:Terpene cyclase DEP1